MKIAVICADNARMFHPQQGAVSTVVINLNERLKNDFEIRTFFGGEQIKSLESRSLEAGNRNAGSYEKVFVSSIERFCSGIDALREPAVPYLKKVAKVLNQWKPDVVHLHNRPSYILWLKKFLHFKPKYILHEHNLQLGDWIAPQLARQILHEADLFVGVSQFVTDFVIHRHFPEFTSKAAVVRNGVDLQSFHPVASESEKMALRKKWGIPPDKTVVLYTGALRACKGVHHLVTAFIDLLKVRQDICLVLTGDNPPNNSEEAGFGESLRRQAQPFSESILFKGFVNIDVLPELYQSADLFCAVPEWEEPLGLVFLEAQASGLPVIATKSGGVVEIVRDGETGMLLDNPVSQELLKLALTELCDHPDQRRQWGQAARGWMEEGFSWAAAAGVMKTLYLRQDFAKLPLH